ncbi:MAG: amino acid permease, partial [Aeriscardovia sp.]|nr:amino acid permease [Aeriscardovia sp.]
PEENLSLNSGLFQTLQYLMYKVTGSYILDWLLDIVCILVCFGIVAEIGSWIVGPSAGLRDSAQYGMMPMGIKKVNKHNVPTNVLIINCILVLCWDALLTFGGSSGAGNVSILVAETLTTCIYLVTYLFMCAAYYTLIFKWKSLHRTYNVPGGIVVKTIVAICGTVTSIFALVVSFFPSTALTPSGQVEYEVLLVIAFIIAIIIPIIISAFHKNYVAKIDPSQIKYLTYKMAKMQKAQAQVPAQNTNANMNA